MANQKNQGSSSEENKVNQTGSQGGGAGRGKQPESTSLGSIGGGSSIDTSSAGSMSGAGSGLGSTSSTGTGSGLGSTGSTGAGSGTTGGTGSTGSSGTGIGSTGPSRMSSGSAGSTGSGLSTGKTSGGSMSGGSGGSTGTGTGTATARSLIDQAKETAGQAYEVAAEKATTKLEEQKSTLSGGLASVAGSVRKVSENLRGPDVQDGISKFTAEYSDVAAKKIEGVANYFEKKSVSEMYRDVEGFARKNPAVFVGGAFALGLVLARFLKSGSSTANTGTIEGSGQGVTGIADHGREIQPSTSGS